MLQERSAVALDGADVVPTLARGELHGHHPSTGIDHRAQRSGELYLPLGVGLGVTQGGEHLGSQDIPRRDGEPAL